MADVEIGAHRRRLRDGAAACFEERKSRRQGFMLLSSHWLAYAQSATAFSESLACRPCPRKPNECHVTRAGSSARGRTRTPPPGPRRRGAHPPEFGRRTAP